MRINRPYPLYPLPEDYADLSAEGQHLARVAAVSRHDTPQHFVESWDFFRRTYLAGCQRQKFYKDGYVESPDFHSDMVYALGQYALNAWAAPRGSAKSTVLDLEISLLLVLTKRFFDISLFFSTDKMKQPRFDVLMAQLTDNELILADFGEMKPKRGSATWNHEYLQLTNGSSISGGSVMGKMRGGRPRLLILDDPENDPDSDSESSRLIIIEKFETILFKKMLPMLKPGTQMFWIGTLIDRRAFLYRVILGDDPRFDYWNRVVLRAIAYDKDDKSKFQLLWPDMWSKDFLDAQKERIGAAAFASEYCNEPVSAQERLLVVDPRKNEYSVDGNFDWQNPLAYQGKIHWQDRIINAPGEHRVYKEMEKSFSDLVSPMFRIIMFDHAKGLSSYNDYSCICVAGFDTLGTMWILSLWLGRAKEDTLLRMIYETGLTWRPRIIGIETVGSQKDLEDAMKEYMTEQEGKNNTPWRARVVPITYPAKESKGQRIASLEWRFNSGRIKYPSHLAHIWPYDQLYAQTADFTIDLALLPHDDVIDTVGMSKYVVKTKGGTLRRERGQLGLLERIIKNQPILQGSPILDGVSSAEISDEMMNVMSQQARMRNIEPMTRRIERPHPKIIY